MDSRQLALRPIATKKDGSFGGKVVTARERSNLANASFRVYYSLRAGAVPFLWESTPGTPKSSGAGATAAVSPAETVGATSELMPPISPPPSYQSSSELKGRRRRRQRSSWPAAAGGVLGALLGVLGLRKRHRRPHGRSTSSL